MGTQTGQNLGFHGIFVNAWLRDAHSSLTTFYIFHGFTFHKCLSTCTCGKMEKINPSQKLPTAKYSRGSNTAKGHTVEAVTQLRGTQRGQSHCQGAAISLSVPLCLLSEGIY